MLETDVEKSLAEAEQMTVQYEDLKQRTGKLLDGMSEIEAKSLLEKVTELSNNADVFITKTVPGELQPIRAALAEWRESYNSATSTAESRIDAFESKLKLNSAEYEGAVKSYRDLREKSSIIQQKTKQLADLDRRMTEEHNRDIEDLKTELECLSSSIERDYSQIEARMLHLLDQCTPKPISGDTTIQKTIDRYCDRIASLVQSTESIVDSTIQSINTDIALQMKEFKNSTAARSTTAEIVLKLAEAYSLVTLYE